MSYNRSDAIDGIQLPFVYAITQVPNGSASVPGLSNTSTMEKRSMDGYKSQSSAHSGPLGTC